MRKRGKWLGTALGALLAALTFAAGPAGAMYLTDGAVATTTAGVYTNPQDGVCVIGVKPDGTLDVNNAITNYKDCVVYTNATLKALTSSDMCTKTATSGSDGFKHAWSTSICVDSFGEPISRVDLDNTNAMCIAKGGTIKTTGLCVAYGWQYMGVKTGEAIPYRTTITPSGYEGRVDADSLGFCYSTMRMTSASGYGTAAGCPSFHNDSTLAPGAEWVAGSDGVKYQTQASYDLGLGWAWDSTNSRCNYTYGRVGYLNAALTDVTGVTATLPLCAGGSGAAATGACVDLTGLTTMGDCLAAGASWDNWLPISAATTPTVPTTLTSTIVKLDATKTVAAGGGKFYSGTGSVCLKCHSDQSRNYAERNKPGYVETGHKKAGDTALWATVGDEWGLKGVQCEICHATGKPPQQDVGIVIYPNGANAGKPRAATGHNQTEYGSHVNGVCFYCHGTATNPVTGNPAAVIPVASGDFALTAKNLAPISNQFLNSPHAEFKATATSSTLDIVLKSNYDSTFVGYICRSAATTISGASTSGACTTAGGTWTQPAGATANGCYYNQTSCEAATGGVWHGAGTFDTNMYPVNNGGVCSGIGLGSIMTTVYRSDSVEIIDNLDSATNDMCTNYADGSAGSGASGYVVREGEAGSTAAVLASSDQGNCMTCHDVHWTLDGSSNPKAEPIRRECTTCHVDPGTVATSASSAPQINLATINHPNSAGTPLADEATTPYKSCEICHMPPSSATGSPMHLWRVNTDSTYATMGTTEANTAADGTYANAAWVDVDFACGQCHKGSLPGAPVFTKVQAAGAAKGMHVGGSVGTPDEIIANCLSCHSTPQGSKPVPAIVPGTNHHSGLHVGGCVACHVSPHQGNPAIRGGKTLVADGNDFCLQCHSNNLPYPHHHVVPTLKAAGKNCKDCHDLGGVAPAPATNANCMQCHNQAWDMWKTNAVVGSVRSVNQGVDHHNGTCTTCHKEGSAYLAINAWATAPNVNATTLKPVGLHNPLPYWAINTSLATACLTCHTTSQAKLGGGTVGAIVPSGTGDNHHNGHSSVPGTSFSGVSEANGSRGANDPGMNCLGCHGKSTIVSGNNTTGYIMKIAASGLSTSTVAAQNGRVNTSGLCLGCHGTEAIQSGPTKNHHVGACVTCHHTDGSNSGAPAAGVGYTAGSPTDPELNSNCLKCHATATGSVGAINLSALSHNTGTGTPTSYTESCVKCHTATVGADVSSVGVAPSVAATCGQCHYGTTGIPVYSLAQLTLAADGIHDAAPVSYPVTFSSTIASFAVNTTASVSCNANCPTFTYDWNWGGVETPDNGLTVATASHLYTEGGSKTITLTVRAGGKKVGASTRTVNLANPDLAPVPGGTCDLNANTWAATFTDASQDDGPDGDINPDASPTLTITVDWGDLTTKSSVARGGIITHTYAKPGTYTVTQTVYDSKNQIVKKTYDLAPIASYFTISGKVTRPTAKGGGGLGGAIVQIKNSANVIVKSVTTSTGALTLGDFTSTAVLKPGKYLLVVVKAGYAFPQSGFLTVGPDQAKTITALTGL